MNTRPGVEQQFFDVTDAAAYLGRSPGAVRHLIQRRRIRFCRTMDGRVVLAREDLDEFAKAVVVEPVAEVGATVVVVTKTHGGRQVGGTVAELRSLAHKRHRGKSSEEERNEIAQ